MTPNPRDGQEARPMFSGHCVWCDRHYFHREPAISYVTHDDNGDPWHYYAHPCCHRLVLAYLDATGEAVPEREPDRIVAREILRRRPDLLDSAPPEDAAWLRSRLLPPTPRPIPLDPFPPPCYNLPSLLGNPQAPAGIPRSSRTYDDTRDTGALVGEMVDRLRSLAKMP